MADFIHHVVQLFILSIALHSSTSVVVAAATESAYDRKVVPGLYETEILNIPFYETVVPLIFEFKVPGWTKEQTVIQRSQNCTSTTFTNSSTCPVLFYLPEIQERLSDYLENSEPFVMNFDPTEPVNTEIQFDCDLIESHFSDLFTSSEAIVSYLEKLKRCSTKEYFYNQQLPNYKYNISDVYIKMRQGFYTEFWMKIHDQNNGRIDAALWSNAIQTLNSLIFNNYYMESNRWKYAVNECKQNRIPQTLITPAVLSDYLELIEDKMSKKNFVLSIPRSRLSKYFSAPFTDCTFTQDTFIIRILVPVLSDHQSFSLVKLSSASFYYTNIVRNSSYICEIGFLSYPNGNNNNYFLVDNLHRLAYKPRESQCRYSENLHNAICHIPSLMNKPKIDSCASSYLTSNFKAIVEYCDLNCEKMTPFHSSFPVFNRVESNKFLLTGSPITTPVIRCPGLKDVHIKAVDIGALEITLPCSCRLYFYSENAQPYSDIDSSSSTCLDTNQGPVLTHIVPLHWVNEKRLVTLDQKPKDRSFRRSGLVIRGNNLFTTNSKYETLALVPGEGQSGGGGGGSSAVVIMVIISFVLTVILIIVLVISVIKVRRMKGDFGFPTPQVSYINAPLLENEESKY